MADEQEQTIRKGREGSRWINERPTGEDVADWFEKNVELPDGLEHKHYLPGIVLIPQNEKSKEVIGFRDGMPVQKEVENRVYIPYAKVETRVKMFWDYMALHEDWFGVIEPVEVEGGKSKGFPPGYFSMRSSRPSRAEARQVHLLLDAGPHLRAQLGEGRDRPREQRA
jgi:hypothetical protein